MQPKAFLFDLDGVITDTASYHFSAWKQLADELGLHFSEHDNERLKGVSRIRSFEIILDINNALKKYSPQQIASLADKKNLYYKKLIQSITPNDILPGIVDFMAEARAENIGLAVASASRNANNVLESLGISSQFDYIADADTICNTKPDPEIFLDCASALGINPVHCVGIEDSQAGIEAIHAANMYSVGINVEVTSYPPNLALTSTSQLSVKSVINGYKSNKGVLL